ncbi:MAG: RHS repeat-associated core domain-containing protein, partial [Gemmatimonadaceae bacterium]
ARVDRRGTKARFDYGAGHVVTYASVDSVPGTPWIETRFPQVAEAQGLAVSGTIARAVAVADVHTLVDGPRPDADVLDHTRVWTDRFGAPAKVRNALGQETVLTRGDGRFPALVTETRAPNDLLTRATYDPRGNLATSTVVSPYGDTRHATTSYLWHQVFDAVERVTLPEGEVTAFGYDARTGNRLWQEDGRGVTSRVNFAYSATWDAPGLMRAIAMPSGARDSVAYDGLGNVAAVRRPDTTWTHFVNDHVGRTTVVRQQLDRVATPKWQEDSTAYDLLDRPTRTASYGPPFGDVEAQKVIVEHFYSQAGQRDSLRRKSDPDPNGIGWITTAWGYDPAGRVIAEIAPDNTPATLADNPADSTFYDKAGNTVRLLTRRGHAIGLAYDALNRLTQRVVPPVVYAREQTLDNRFVPSRPNSAGGALTLWADTARFTYDALGNLSTATNRDARVERTSFPNGALATDTLRIRTYAALDSGGSFSAHLYGLTHGYDLNGRRLWIKHPLQLAPRVNGVIRDSVAYAFDPVIGALVSVRDPLGNLFRFTYDAEGRPDSTIYPGGLVEKVLQYDATGLVQRRVEKNRSGLTGITAFPDTVVRDERFTRDATGRVTRMINTGGYQDTLWLTYTGIGALASSTNSQRTDPHKPPGQGIWNSSQEFFTWDALGNRKQSYSASYSFPESNPFDRFGTGGSGPQTGLYAPSTGRLAKHEGVSDTLIYDRAGNLTKHTQELEARIAAFSYYSADNKLRMSDSRSYDVPPSGLPQQLREHVAEYRYDALGRRVLARTYGYCLYQQGGEAVDQGCKHLIRRTVWDGDQELYEMQYRVDSTSAATLVASLEADTVTLAADTGFYGRVAYVHAGGIDRPLALIRIGYKHFYNNGYPSFGPMAVAMHYGFRNIMDWGSFDNGALKRCSNPSDVNSCVSASSPQTLNAFRPGNQRPQGWWGTLPGDKQDGSGLLYRRNRYYDAGSGRFTQEDPIGLAGGLNLYGFAGGDPVNFSDPFGLCERPNGKGVGICLETFIQGTFGGLGDNRGARSDGGSYKTSIRFSVDPKTGAVSGLSKDIGATAGL